MTVGKGTPYSVHQTLLVAWQDNIIDIVFFLEEKEIVKRAPSSGEQDIWHRICHDGYYAGLAISAFAMKEHLWLTIVRATPVIPCCGAPLCVLAGS